MEKKINFEPFRDYVICEWYVKEEKESKIKLVGNAAQDALEELNGINEILAVGPDCKQAKVGQFAMVGHMEVPIVNIDGIPCAMYKEHMLMGAFDSKPDVEENKNSKEGPVIRTKKTEQKAVDFAHKYKQ
jgi:hypothetical protein